MEFRSDATVMLIQAMGTDSTFAKAARRSSKQYDKIKGAKGLINCLVLERHGSPFEHSGMTVEVEAPIFVAREWMRHRVPWSYSELSGRYSEFDPVFWIPAQERGVVNVGTAMRPELHVDPDLQGRVTESMQRVADLAWSEYQELLQDGVAKEVARACLPVGTFTNFWATANARGIMHFLSLRVQSEDARYPSYPQFEIDQAARQLETFFAGQWPITYEAFTRNGRVSP